MQNIIITHMVYMHYSNGVYSDLRGYILNNTTYIPLKDVFALFDIANVGNAELIHGSIRHKSGTDKIYKITLKSVEKRYNKSILQNDILINVNTVAKYKHRDCFDNVLQAFLSDDNCITALYGVRRTGKTVLMKQIALELSKNNIVFDFFTCTSEMRMSDVYSRLKEDYTRGVFYVFIDELTEVDDFLNSCSFLGNSYASSMHIMVAGTNSFQFKIASEDILFDRIKLFSMSYISFAEFNRLLDKDFLTYLKYGGLLYNDFKDYTSTHNFKNSAIISNWLSVFKDKDYCNQHQDLYLLYKQDELSGYINRVLESNAAKTLLGVFESARLGSALDLLSRRNIQFNDINTLQRIADTFKYRLEVRQTRLNQTFDSEIVRLIDDYLVQIGVMHKTKTVKFITIPGLVYSLSLELIASITEEMENGVKDFRYELLKQLIIEDIEGILTENVIMYDTIKSAASNYSVFKYKSASKFEFDMVVANTKTGEADLYEIKRSVECIDTQAKFLTNEDVNIIFKRDCYPIIRNRIVLYNGITCDKIYNNILVRYINITEYLKNCPYKY